MANYLFNNILLPEIPSSLPSDTYPYLLITKSRIRNNYYYLYILGLEVSYYTGGSDTVFANHNETSMKYGYYYLNMESYINEEYWTWTFNVDSNYGANKTSGWLYSQDYVWSNFDMYYCDYNEKTSDYIKSNRLLAAATLPILHNTVTGIAITAPNTIERGQSITLDIAVEMLGAADDTCAAAVYGTGENTTTSITRVEDAEAEQFILHCGQDETEDVLRVEVTSINNPRKKAVKVIRVLGEYGEIPETENAVKRADSASGSGQGSSADDR